MTKESSSNDQLEGEAAGVNIDRVKATEFHAPDAQEEITKSSVKENLNTSLEFKQNSTDTNLGKSWWHSQFNLMLVVFALLVFAALLLVLVTPSPTVEVTNQEQSTVNNADAAVGAQDNNTPWDESRRAQARTDAQEILSNLLDGKQDLEAKQVQVWAAQEFAQALSIADQGDEFYKLQDYQNALKSYQTAVDELNALYDLLPAYTRSQLAAGLQAIQEGKSQLAEQAFSSVIKVEPDNFAAMNGLERAKNLDQVLQLLQDSKDELQLFEENDDLTVLQLAEQKLQQAFALDKQNDQAKSQMLVIEKLRTDKLYRDSMSQGFKALFANSYTTANSAFANALKYKPSDPTADLAYKQSLASNKTASLQSLISRAQQLESTEDWHNALSNYQAVLQRDSNQITAKLGEIRSRARGQLDQQLRDMLSDKLAFGKTSQKIAAQNLLGEAKAIPSAGPLLQAQIAQLEEAIELAEVSVKVQITSDSASQITLSKEGSSRIDLGQFNVKNLVLKPGRYVLTGVRAGFRDERKELELHPGSTELHYFELRCDKPINLVSQQVNGNDAAQ